MYYTRRGTEDLLHIWTGPEESHPASIDSAGRGVQGMGVFFEITRRITPCGGSSRVKVGLKHCCISTIAYEYYYYYYLQHYKHYVRIFLLTPQKYFLFFCPNTYIFIYDKYEFTSKPVTGPHTHARDGPEKHTENVFNCVRVGRTHIYIYIINVRTRTGF